MNGPELMIRTSVCKN